MQKDLIYRVNEERYNFIEEGVLKSKIKNLLEFIGRYVKGLEIGKYLMKSS